MLRTKKAGISEGEKARLEVRGGERRLKEAVERQRCAGGGSPGVGDQ